MKTKLPLWINSALFAAAALWFLVIPALSLIRDVRDPALAAGGVPRCVFAWHRHLSREFAPWARGTLQGGLGAHVGQYDIKGTEWPAHSAMFYLLATESLQQAWERDHSLSPVAPAVYARDSIDAAAALLTDPVNATWVRNFWGDDRYLKTQDVFFRMMVINGLTAHLALTGDRPLAYASSHYADFLRDQAGSLAAELDASPHGLLDDYPGQCYPVDIVPAIAGIQRVDRLLGGDHSAMIVRAERLLEGPVIDPASGLPGYAVVKLTGEPLEPARGTGMSMILVWSPQLWPEQSANWYASYVRQFWQQDKLLAGFREYRKGSVEPEWQGEVDSGPVIAGYGTAASAFGLSAAQVNGDHLRGRLLAMEAITAAWPLPDGALPGARVLSTPDAPYTGVTALLFALTRTPENTAPWPPPAISHITTPPPANASLAPDPASMHTPGFVLLFIGGGLTFGLLMLLSVASRLTRPCREMGRVAFGIWCALMLSGIALWFIHPWWGVMSWLAAQWFPRAAKKPSRIIYKEVVSQT